MDKSKCSNCGWAGQAKECHNCHVLTCPACGFEVTDFDACREIMAGMADDHDMGKIAELKRSRDDWLATAKSLSLKNRALKAELAALKGE